MLTFYKHVDVKLLSDYLVKSLSFDNSAKLSCFEKYNRYILGALIFFLMLVKHVKTNIGLEFQTMSYSGLFFQ